MLPRAITVNYPAGALALGQVNFLTVHLEELP